MMKNLDYDEELDYDDDFITNDKFRQFLIDNNCLDKFIDNCNNGDNQYYINDFSSINPTDYILTSFDWVHTPEGSKFWNDLYHKWYNLFNPEIPLKY